MTGFKQIFDDIILRVLQNLKFLCGGVCSTIGKILVALDTKFNFYQIPVNEIFITGAVLGAVSVNSSHHFYTSHEHKLRF
jgi:hypothetical protein